MRSLRVAKGLRLVDVAGDAWNFTALSRAERGLRGVPDAVKPAIAQRLGVSVEELFSYETGEAA